MKNLLILIPLLLAACGQDSSSGDGSAAPDKSVQTLAEAQGQAGAKGEKGDTGPAGKDGAPGKDGKTVIVTADMWFDPIDQRYWLTAGKVTYSQAAKVCSGQWRLPTYEELELSIMRGQPKVRTSSVWSSSPSATTGNVSVMGPVGNGDTYIKQDYPTADEIPGGSNILQTRCVEAKSQF